MRRRKMKWNTPILIVTFTLLMIIVNGLNDEEGLERMSMELVHRHDARIVGHVDHVEAIKGFIKRDSFRRELMSQRWGLKDKNNRIRNDLGKNEMKKKNKKEEEEFQMALRSDFGLGEYFVQVEVGTPGQKFWVGADTGSDLTWFNCKPKHKKIHKNHVFVGAHKKTRRRRVKRSKKNSCDGVFCPHKSHSFQPVKCSSKKCQEDLIPLAALPKECPNPSDPCLYFYSYDESSAEGFFGIETITLNLVNGKKGKFHDQTIGCTTTIRNDTSGGLLGLGYSLDSFIDKAGLQYGAKFSYCLVDQFSHKNVSSYLTFGNHKVKLLSEMKKTQLILQRPPYYGVKIEGISIGDEMLKIPSKVWDFDEGGGTIIDSGYTLTAFPLEAYEPVMKTLSKYLTKFNRIEDHLEYCYDKEGFDESVVPRLVFHFEGGVRFEPPVKSYIIDPGPDYKCIGIVLIKGHGNSVIGNIMQQNHLWEFDLTKKTVGFAPSACN